MKKNHKSIGQLIKKPKDRVTRVEMSKEWAAGWAAEYYALLDEMQVVLIKEDMSAAFRLVRELKAVGNKGYDVLPRLFEAIAAAEVYSQDDGPADQE